MNVDTANQKWPERLRDDSAI